MQNSSFILTDVRLFHLVSVPGALSSHYRSFLVQNSSFLIQNSIFVLTDGVKLQLAALCGVGGVTAGVVLVGRVG